MAMNKDATLSALKTAIRMEFQKGLAAEVSHFKEVASVIPSSSAQSTYAFLSQFPQMREFIGPRVIQSMKEGAYTVANKLYESTFGIAVTDLEDDNIGHYGLLGLARGEEVVKHKNRLIFNKMQAGFTETCFDGQFFFDTDHPVNSKVDGSGVNASVSNVILGTGTPLVASNENPWYLIKAKGSLKPFILQERTKAELVDKDSSKKSDHVFMNDEHLMGVRWRGAAAFALWQLAVASRTVLDEANFELAFAMMMGFKAHGGDPLGLMPDTLVVGKSNRAAGRKIVEIARLANGADNANYKAVDLVVVPWLP